jgi:hypothetical protein
VSGQGIEDEPFALVLAARTTDVSLHYGVAVDDQVVGLAHAADALTAATGPQGTEPDGTIHWTGWPVIAAIVSKSRS